MIKDITIGQYYPSKSVIHSLDARAKLIITFFYIVSLFVANGFAGFAAAFVFFAAVLVMSKIPLKHVLKGLRPILFIIVFTMLINFLLGTGDVIAEWWIFKIRTNGLRRGLFFAVRIVLLMLGTSLMTYTTTVNQLTDAMESVLKPLKLIRVPVHELAMVMSIALRFIPILLDETEKIKKAQLARGADFESGNILKRARALVPIFIPLIISAFRRAFDLAMAMEARCYHGGDGRTKMRPMKYRGRDYAAYAVSAVYFAAAVVIRVI